MQKYRVMINGKNLLTDVEGVRQRLGFYTTVFVEAFTPADAESRAIDVLREDAHLSDIALNAEDDPLRFSVDEVHEIESFDGVRLPRMGLALYEEKADDSDDAT
jgi:capsule polysaccharide export protein KpsE/RkpR